LKEFYPGYYELAKPGIFGRVGGWRVESRALRPDRFLNLIEEKYGKIDWIRFHISRPRYPPWIPRRGKT
jgi:hypothetical protein